MENQYLNKNVLLNTIKLIEVKPEDLGSSDSYNETKILEKFQQFPKDVQDLLYKSAIQLSVIGYGNKNFGFIRLNDKNIIKLEDLFNKHKIKFLEKLNEKYKDDEISARRLMRLLRYQIQSFIIETKRPSFLYLKYSDRNEKYMSVCFPGAEHLIETEDEADYLIKTYKNLDIQRNTKFVERLNRVFIARHVISPISNKNY